jgi:peptide/nickel transport system substrate-binding protein
MRTFSSIMRSGAMFARISWRAALAVLVATSLTVIQFDAIAAEKKIIRIGWEGDPTTLDPPFWGTAPDQYLFDSIYPRLAKPVPGREWQYELDAAKSVDMSDPTMIKFELKPGVMWTGGYGELTAEDVKYSIERNIDPKLASPAKDLLAALKEVEVTGKYSGIIHFKYPAVHVWGSTLTYVYGALVSKKATEKAGGKIPYGSRVTSGAYKIKEHIRGERMVLEKDPNWIGRQAYYDEVVLLPIEDENAALAAFAAGEVDWIELSFQNAQAIKAKGMQNGTVDIRSTLDPVWLGINALHAGLSDIRVRQAIQKAIDVPTVVKAVWGDSIKPATGIAAPGMIGYRDIKTPQPDVKAARKLIKEAGADGLKLKLTLPNYDEMVTAAQVIQANLVEIGLNIELVPQDDATFYDISAATAADRQLTLQWWAGNVELMYSLEFFVPGQAWNWQGFDSKEYMDLLNKARGEPDLTKRARMYDRMHEVMVESGTFLYLANPPQGFLYRNSIKPGMLPDGRPVFHAFKPAPAN